MSLDITNTQQRTIIDFRSIGFDDLQVLGKYNYVKSEKELADHTHYDMIEICYCDKGEQYFFNEESKYLVSGGEIFINFPNEIHGTGNHLESKGTLYWLIIKLNTDNSSLQYLCHELIKKKIRHFKGNGMQKQLLDNLFKSYSHDDGTLKKIRIETLVKSFLISLFDSLNIKNVKTQDNRLNDLLSYIGKNLTENLNIANLADRVNLSESRFKILFKESTGFTPNDYIQRERVQKAIDILNSCKDLTLSEVAYQFNFSSPQYFSTVVRKYLGASPSQLRKFFNEL